MEHHGTSIVFAAHSVITIGSNYIILIVPSHWRMFLHIYLIFHAYANGGTTALVFLRLFLISLMFAHGGANNVLSACVASDTLLMLHTEHFHVTRSWCYALNNTFKAVRDAANIWEAKRSLKTKVSILIPCETFVEKQKKHKIPVNSQAAKKKKLPKMGPPNHMKSTLKHLVGAVVKWCLGKHNAHFVSANIPPAGCLCLDVQNDLLYIICFFGWI